MQLDTVWKQMLWNIIKHGHRKMKDDSGIIEHIDNHFFIEPPYDMIMLGKKMTPELYKDLAQKGAFDIPNYLMSGQALVDYMMSLDDDDMTYFSDFSLPDGNDSDFVYTYPERIQSIATIDSMLEDAKVYFEDQIGIIVERLQEHLYTNRAVASLYIPGIDGFREDIPCLNWFQVLVKDNCLTLHVMFRSNDIYQAFPANMLFLMYLGVNIVYYLHRDYPDLYFGGIYYNSTSAHIYETNEAQVRALLGAY